MSLTNLESITWNWSHLKAAFSGKKSPTWCIKSERMGCDSNSNLEATAECTLPQNYREVYAFLTLVGHCRRFIKGFTCMAQQLSGYLTGQGASRKSEQVSLTEENLKAFKALKQACMMAPILAFADYTKPFLLETNSSKDGLGAVLWQKQADGQYYPVAYGSRALMSHEKNYHSTNFKFLALKWAVMEHFQEYLPYQSFLVRTGNNPLTYTMSAPNLDAMGHGWIGALVQFNFELEYQKGCDNSVADAFGWVTTWLDPDTVESILNGVTLETAHWAEVHDPAVVEGDQHLEQEVCVAAGCALIEMHVTDWAEAQREDLMMNAVFDWLKAQKQTNLKALLAEYTSSEEGILILQNWQNFMIHQGGLVPALNTQRWDWRSPAVHGPQGPSCCHLEQVPLGCRSSEMWPYLVFAMGAFLVARYDQPDAAVYQVLHTLLAAWGWFV